MVDVWYTDKVVHGSGGGKRLGFPTINLDPSRFIADLKEGVYYSLVMYGNKTYLGALYFGPRLVNKETKPVLEIYILNFHKDIYGETVEYTVGQFIRGVMDFENMEELKKQIQKDVEKIKSL
ncbi:riboflavin kinase [Candidatus Roizmanbacteria bacterium]|nr:riboflavin kinase [Candidatus Roizmanbacteria bacterium]